MDIELPNGHVLEGVPEGTSRSEVKRKAIAAGLATAADFGDAPEQPKSYKSAVAGNVGTPAQMTATAVQAADTQSQLEAQAKMKALEQSNPYLAETIKEMNPAERAAVGYQTGLREVARGIGLGGADEATIAAEQALTDTSRAASIGEVVGQAAPFIPAGIGAGSIASTPLRMAANTALGAAEGGIISNGTAQSGSDVVKDSLTGGAIGLAVDSVPLVGAALNRFISKRIGREVPVQELITADGKPTQQFQDFLSRRGETFDQVVDAAKSEAGTAEEFATAAQATARQLENPNPGQFDRVAAIANLDPEKVAAFERAGFAPEDIPIASVSRDVRVAQIGAQLAAVPGSLASEQLANAAKKVTQFAKDTIADAGGRLDAGTFSDNTLNSMRESRDAIYAVENDAYKKIGQALDEKLPTGPNAPKVAVRADQLRRELTEKKSKLRATELSNVESHVLSVLNRKPTYYDIDNLRKEIGNSIGGIPSGVYANQSQGTLKYLYRHLQEAQDRFARGTIGDNSLRSAQDIVKQRKALEDQIEFFNKNDGFGSMLAQMGQVVRGVKNNDYSQFDRVMANLPEQYRKPALATLINDSLKIRSDAASERTLSAADFEQFWGNVRSDSALRSRFEKVLGKESFDTFDHLQKLAQGISKASSGRPTGIATAAIKNWNSKNGVVDKIASVLRVGSRAAGAGEAGSIAAQSLEGVAKIASANQDSNIDKVSRLLSAPTFMRAAIESAKDPASSQAKALNAQLLKTKVANDFISAANADVRRQILMSGGIPLWLMSNDAGEEK